MKASAGADDHCWGPSKLRELVVVVVEGVGWGILPLLEPGGGRRQVKGATAQSVIVDVRASWGGPQGLPGLRVVAGQCTWQRSRGRLAGGS